VHKPFVSVDLPRKQFEKNCAVAFFLTFSVFTLLCAELDHFIHKIFHKAVPNAQAKFEHLTIEALFKQQKFHVHYKL